MKKPEFNFGVNAENNSQIDLFAGITEDIPIVQLSQEIELTPPPKNTRIKKRIFRKINKTDNWLTPRELIRSLGEFDLDPCSSPSQSSPIAKVNFVLPEHNGLLEPWEGRVWCNPPFSQMASWAHKFANHRNGIMICPLRLQVKWSQVLLDTSDAILLVRESIGWQSADGTKLGDLFDFALYAYGEQNVIALSTCKIKGLFLFQNTLDYKAE